MGEDGGEVTGGEEGVLLSVTVPGLRYEAEDEEAGE